jgi:hypothetical protein
MLRRIARLVCWKGLALCVQQKRFGIHWQVLTASRFGRACFPFASPINQVRNKGRGVTRIVGADGGGEPCSLYFRDELRYPQIEFYVLHCT